MKAIYLEWMDAVNASGWHDSDEVNKLTVHDCRTIGYVVKETDREIVVASTLSVDPKDDKTDANALMVIPKVWIKKRRKISL